MHNIATITPTSTATYFIRISLNASSSADTGGYKLRVLPPYGEATGTWDNNFEPNNRLSNAYSLATGVSNAITGTIAAKSASFATNYSDFDWYRIDLTTGNSYTVELFSVAAALKISTSSDYGLCGISYTSGLAIEVFDSSNSRVKSQYAPTGTTPTHNSLTYTPTISGTYFIRISLNASSSGDSGQYSLQLY